MLQLGECATLSCARLATFSNFLARSVPLRRPRKLALPSGSTVIKREREDLTTEANTAAAKGHGQPAPTSQPGTRLRPNKRSRPEPG